MIDQERDESRARASIGQRVTSALGMVAFGLFVLVGAAAAVSISAWEVGNRIGPPGARLPARRWLGRAGGVLGRLPPTAPCPELRTPLPAVWTSGTN